MPRGLGSEFYLKNEGSWERSFGKFESCELKLLAQNKAEMQNFIKNKKGGAHEQRFRGKMG